MAEEKVKALEVLYEYEMQIDCSACGHRLFIPMNQTILFCENPHCRSVLLQKRPIRKNLKGGCIPNLPELMPDDFCVPGEED